ncbi:alpha/beta fold hydrolase [Sphaerisporangium fuscum]|uniref:alpha/beta fold hydrolase n=1 Tax=Sphaerisporangium fuscum TaxID=2835868 RepID=UPI002029A50C|nr:alpha/beta hydrolase [Sphaerisporangium fuscum]
MTDTTRRAMLRQTSQAALAGLLATGALAPSAHADADAKANAHVHTHADPDADADAAHRCRPTFVLVHGSNGGSGFWGPIIGELAVLGYRALAVDLPGHGPAAWYPASYQSPQDLGTFATERSPLADVTLQDYVTHVTGVVRRAAAHGPVVLAGHSLGGVTITGVGNAVPHLISRIVYISAFCCSTLGSVLECYQSPEGRDSLVLKVPHVGDPAKTGALRTNWRTADPGFLATVKAAFLADGTDDMLRVVINECQPDEPVSISLAEARIAPETWGRIDRTYIRLRHDRSLPLALQDRMIRDADAQAPGRFRVETLDTSHLGILSKAHELAGLLAGLA